jgi:hypothetical protein
MQPTQKLTQDIIESYVFNHHKNFPADGHFSIENLTHAKRVCVKAFTIRYEVY